MRQEGREPLLSIITITYNAERTLQRTIDSVGAQDYERIEYIVVDGASTDGTMDIVRRNMRTVSKYVSEPDGGLYDAMNKGLGMATGDYVWFVNSGDEIYSPTTASSAMRMAVSVSEGVGSGVSDGLADVVYGDTVIVSDDGTVLGPRRLSPPETLTWRDFRKGMLVCHQSFIARRAVAPSYDLRFRFSADYDWCLRTLRASRRIVNAHAVLSRFLDGGLTGRNMSAGLKERFRVMVENYGLLPTLWRHVGFAIRIVAYRLRHGRV